MTTLMSRVALWISSVRPLGGVRAISLCHRVDANKLLATTTLLLHDNNDSNHFHLDNQAYTFPLVPSLTGMLPLVTNGTWRVFPSLSLRGRSSTLTFSPAAIDYHHDPSLFYCFQTIQYTKVRTFSSRSCMWNIAPDIEYNFLPAPWKYSEGLSSCPG